MEWNLRIVKPFSNIKGGMLGAENWLYGMEFKDG